MYYLNQKTLCTTSNHALGSAKLPFLVKKNERTPPYFTPLIQTDIENKDDDQLFYTKIFLNGIEDVKIKLDTKAELFQNLNGAVGRFNEPHFHHVIKLATLLISS